MLNSAMDIVERIHQLGFEAHLVGGCVRDMVMGVEPHDIDVATNCDLSILEKEWMCHEIGQSKSFGIITVRHNGFDFEVANWRVDGVSSDGRRPDSIEIAETLEEDVSRRDLTINAMAEDEWRDFVTRAANKLERDGVAFDAPKNSIFFGKNQIGS